MLAIRDSVHKWITVSPAEMKLIDTPLFQRLRGIKQLTTANFVYPDACHTRFSHSLGTMYVATLYAESLAEKYHYTQQWVKSIRLAALLHDIAHGPFSHAYDHYVYNALYSHTDKGHDVHREKIVRELDSQLRECGVTPDEIIDVWKSTGVAGAVLSGPLGADRTDFLLRDALMCGMDSFGGVDYKRLVHNVEVDDDRLVYPAKLSAEIQNFLIGRTFMYDNVYLHKTSLSGNYLLMKIFDACVKPLCLLERTVNPLQFIELTDSALLEEAKSVPEALPWVTRFLERKLPRAIEDTAGYASRTLETLDRTKFNHYNIGIKTDDGQIHGAHKWLKANGIIKDVEYTRTFLFEDK